MIDPVIIESVHHGVLAKCPRSYVSHMLWGRQKGLCKGYRIAGETGAQIWQNARRGAFSEELNFAARTGNILRITWQQDAIEMLLKERTM